MVENDGIYLELWRALNDGNVDHVISILRENDVNVDYRDVTHDLQTFLMRVCYVELETSQLLNVLEAIFDLHPDVNIQDSWGRTVLMHACIANKPVLIEGLLEYEDTDVSLTDFDGNSALTYAVQHCDKFTVEDILQHPAGAKLLSIHNAKGQSPVNIAQKKGDKTIVRLLDSYINNSAVLDPKKKRKPRNRDVANLPPTYSPSPERTAKNPSANKVVQYNLNSSCNIYNNRKQTSEQKIDISAARRESSSEHTQKEKCDSAPVLRGNRTSREEITSSLSLSSPKLVRRHHKQDCLLQETLLLNQSRNFPEVRSQISSTVQTETDNTLDLPEHSLRRQRRPSLSLPDLRSARGFLVNSGSSTPTTEGDRGSPRRDFNDDEDLNNIAVDSGDDEEVFSKSCPNPFQKNKQGHEMYRRQNSAKYVTLPEVPKGKTCFMSPSNARRNFKHIDRQRKYSNSDDHLDRSASKS